IYSQRSQQNFDPANWGDPRRRFPHVHFKRQNSLAVRGSLGRSGGADVPGRLRRRLVPGDGVSSRTIKPVRIESLLAGVLNVGTWLASVVIVAGLVLSLFKRTPFPTGAQVVTAGIGFFILL